MAMKRTKFKMATRESNAVAQSAKKSGASARRDDRASAQQRPRMSKCWSLPLILVIAMGAPAASAAQAGTTRFINPPTLSPPPGYSHVAAVPPGSTLLFISGQVPLDSTGALVGAGDLRAQTVQVFENLRRALAAGGATFRDVVKITIYMVDASQLAVVREVRTSYLNTAAPPASTLAEVRRLFREDVLVEIEAVAVVPTAAHGR